MIESEDLDALEASLGHSWGLDESTSHDHLDRGLPINIAVAGNRVKAIDYLLSKGADLNVPDLSAIVFAMKACSPETIDRLVAAGGRLDGLDSRGYDAFACAVMAGRHDLLPYLQAKGLSAKMHGLQGMHAAVDAGDTEALRFFLANDADADGIDRSRDWYEGRTLIHWAVESRKHDVVRLLLDRGADASIAADSGESPLARALYNRDAVAVDILAPRLPAEARDPTVKEAMLRRHNAPQGLIELLKSNSRTFGDALNANAWRIEFHALEDVYERIWGGMAYPTLLLDVEDYYPETFLVWSQQDGKLATICEDRNELHAIASWEQFMADPLEVFLRAAEAPGTEDFLTRSLCPPDETQS